MSDAPAGAMEVIMLDTNIVSDMMRNPRGAAHASLRRRLQKVPDLRVLASVIVDCEIRYGLLRKGSSRLQQAYQDLLQVVEIAPLGPESTQHYQHIRTHLERMGQPIGPNDTLIAAHALAMDATLASADSEFTRVPGLKLENWLQPLSSATTTP